MSAKTKKFRSNWFRVAVEGATSDGRKIERNWLEQIASTYDPNKYGARIFIEHIRGLNPEWGFRCMGDVLAVKTETVQIDGKDHLALMAQIQPTDELIALNKRGQKIYSSIEVDPDFAGKGSAYLVGLGVTDTPASLGTEVLAFAAQHPDASPLKARKQSPNNVFSVAIESALQFEEFEEAPGVLEGFFSRLEGLLGKKETEGSAPAPQPQPQPQEFSNLREAVTVVADHVRQQEERFTAATRDNAELRNQVQKLSADLVALRAQLDGTPDPGQTSRPPVAGPVSHATDC